MKNERLCLFEWAILAYAAFTLMLMALWWEKLVNPVPMLMGRLGAVAMTICLWQVYRRWPSRWTMVMRVAAPLCMLGWWYPDTYELNRFALNLDHVFAGMEQSVFGCQPALLFSQEFTSPVLSELLCLGYVSYFPMIGALSFWYFLKRYDRLAYATFVILASFFLFYVIFIFLPVAGPQFYYAAVDTDLIAQGVFPNMGHYFLDHQGMVDIPGVEGGLFHDLVQLAHDAGERPTAAFPSSHVGISVVLLWLAWEARAKWLFTILAVLTLLMFFATFYIQAHYAIDAIAGLFTGTLLYFLMKYIYKLLEK
jgi:membrane-associated phospholipid phosphatase